MGGQSFSADLAAGARGAPVHASLIPRRSFQATGYSCTPAASLKVSRQVVTSLAGIIARGLGQGAVPRGYLWARR